MEDELARLERHLLAYPNGILRESIEAPTDRVYVELQLPRHHPQATKVTWEQARIVLAKLVLQGVVK